MLPPRILLVQEDQLLSRFYREQLENSGYVVDAVQRGDEAMTRARTCQPDAVLIDSLTSGLDAADVVRAFRTEDASRSIPIVALPSNRAPIARALQLAGAEVLPRVPDLAARVTSTVAQVLGRPLADPPDARPARWSRLNTAEAPQVLNTMRHSIQTAVRTPASRDALRELLQEVHGFTERLALFAQRPLFQFSAALEALVYELNRMAEHASPSVLRTIGQAVDFCGVLIAEASQRELREPSTAQALVVDDEEGAARIIMASLGLVNVRSVACATPASALAAVAAQTFDLIFLDVGLPSMNGFELCPRIRGTPNYEKTPIIFVTGMHTFQNRVQSNLSGGDDFIGKPFNIPELGLKALMWLLKGQIATPSAAQTVEPPAATGQRKF